MNNVYGYCPRCGGLGMSRERRLNGNDRCENGHSYPSSTAVTNPLLPVAPATAEMLAGVIDSDQSMTMVDVGRDERRGPWQVPGDTRRTGPWFDRGSTDQ